MTIIDKELNLKYKNCKLIKSVKDLNNIFISLCKEEIKKCLQDFHRFYINGSHLTNKISCAVKLLAETYEISPMVAIKEFYLKRYKAMLNQILKGNIIVLKENNSWFPITDKNRYKIEKDSKQEKYTEKDIKISRWEGGRHYYAKVGNIQVKDEFDNIKWSSYDIAYTYALEFLKKLNKIK